MIATFGLITTAVKYLEFVILAQAEIHKKLDVASSPA